MPGRARLPDRLLDVRDPADPETVPVTDINSRPRFRKLVKYADGVVDKRGREVPCDHHPELPAIWSGERRPVSRIMFYPFNWCGECLRAGRGADNGAEAG